MSFFGPGGGSSPFASAAGVITKVTAADTVQFQANGADAVQLIVNRGSDAGTPAADIVRFNNAANAATLSMISANGGFIGPQGSASAVGCGIDVLGLASRGNGMYSAGAGTGRLAFAVNTFGVMELWYNPDCRLNLLQTAGVFSINLDVIFSRRGAANWQLGAADAASPVAQTLSTQGSRSGTDSNVAGANLTIDSGRGTGNAAGSFITFRCPVAVGSGTGAQTMTDFFLMGTSISGSRGNVTYFVLGAPGTGTFPNDGCSFFVGNTIFNQAFAGLGRIGNNSGNGQLSLDSLGRIAWCSTATALTTASLDTFITRGGAAATIQLGAADSATPVGQTFRAQGSRAGTDNNVAGGNLTIQPGTGTGNATGSSLLLRVIVPVASGTGAQTPTTVHTMNAAVGDQVGAFRFQQAQGAAVASANNLVLGSDGNYFQISGTTQINLIDNTNWQGGARVTLKFQGIVTVKDNQAASGNNKPIMLAGGVDLVTAANVVLDLIYDSTDAAWFEVARSLD